MLAQYIIFIKIMNAHAKKGRNRELVPIMHGQWEAIAKKPSGLRQYEAGLHGASCYVI